MRSADIDQTAACLKEIRIKYKTKAKQLTIQLTKELSVDWTTSCHMCIIQAIEDAMELPNKLRELLTSHLLKAKWFWYMDMKIFI